MQRQFTFFNNIRLYFLTLAATTYQHFLWGPSEETGPDVDNCYDFSSSSTATPSTTGTSSTPQTTDTTSKAEQCDQFVAGSCDIEETNTVDLLHDVTVGDCQDTCRHSQPCTWFTWYNVSGTRLLSHREQGQAVLELRKEVAFSIWWMKIRTWMIF